MLIKASIIVGMGLSTLLPSLIATASADDSQIVRTQSGKVRCVVSANDIGHGGGPQVACQTSAPDNHGFTQAPAADTPGFRYDIAAVSSTGAFRWDDGNIPGTAQALANDLVMAYGQSYQINGWAIQSSFDGTRFTNMQTGHGMFVSIDDVSQF